MAKAHVNVKVKSLNTKWVADNAYKMVLNGFTQNPDIKGVFSHNDEMIRGIVSALRQIGKLDPPSNRVTWSSSDSTARRWRSTASARELRMRPWLRTPMPWAAAAFLSR